MKEKKETTNLIHNVPHSGETRSTVHAHQPICTKSWNTAHQTPCNEAINHLGEHVQTNDADDKEDTNY